MTLAVGGMLNTNTTTKSSNQLFLPREVMAKLDPYNETKNKHKHPHLIGSETDNVN